MPRHATHLLAAKADETCCCFIGDFGQIGATVLFRNGQWLVVQHFVGNAVKTCEEIALVTLGETADAESLHAAALAKDFRSSLWLCMTLTPYRLKLKNRNDKKASFGAVTRLESHCRTLA